MCEWRGVGSVRARQGRCASDGPPQCSFFVNWDGRHVNRVKDASQSTTHADVAAHVAADVAMRTKGKMWRGNWSIAACITLHRRRQRGRSPRPGASPR